MMKCANGTGKITKDYVEVFLDVPVEVLRKEIKKGCIRNWKMEK